MIPSTVERSSALKYMGVIDKNNNLTSSVNEIYKHGVKDRQTDRKAGRQAGMQRGMGAVDSCVDGRYAGVRGHGVSGPAPVPLFRAGSGPSRRWV